MNYHPEITTGIGRPCPGVFKTSDARPCGHRRTRDSLAGTYAPNSAGAELQPPAGLTLPSNDPRRMGSNNSYGMSAGHRVDLTTGDGSIANCGCPGCTKLKARDHDFPLDQRLRRLGEIAHEYGNERTDDDYVHGAEDIPGPVGEIASIVENSDEAIESRSSEPGTLARMNDVHRRLHGQPALRRR